MIRNRPHSRRALTLIEVIAGLALMGTLLTVVLVAGSKHASQLKQAERKREATRRLDALLTHWSQSHFDRTNFSDSARRARLHARSAVENDHDRLAAAVTDSYIVRMRTAPARDLENAIRIEVSVWFGNSTDNRGRLAWAEVIASS
ncbi:MAG: type II secretion system protein [Planctomycetota bacterium]